MRLTLPYVSSIVSRSPTATIRSSSTTIAPGSSTRRSSSTVITAPPTSTTELDEGVPIPGLLRVLS
jgi:hypothetical protein